MPLISTFNPHHQSKAEIITHTWSYFVDHFDDGNHCTYHYVMQQMPRTPSVINLSLSVKSCVLVTVQFVYWAASICHKVVINK